MKDVSQYVEKNIGTFHEKRIQSLDSLKLSQVLKRKNPYLFKAKYFLTAEKIIRGIVDAHISSSEEGIFGDWLEGLAIYINEKVYGGKKSGKWLSFISIAKVKKKNCLNTETVFFLSIKKY